MRKLLVVLIILLLTTPAVVHSAGYSPLFNANCLAQDAGIGEITWLYGSGMVEWNAAGEPTAYQLGIIDTTNRGTIARLVSLSGRPTWVGYPQGWDIDAQTLALHPYRHYRLFDASGFGDGIGRYIVTAHGPFGNEMYLNAYTHHGFTNGVHPCNSIAVSASTIYALEGGYR